MTWSTMQLNFSNENTWSYWHFPKMWHNVLVLFFVLQVLLQLDILTFASTEINHTVTFLDDLLLECGHETGALSKWKYSGNVIYVLNLSMDSTLTTGLLLFKNYSMLITSVSLSHEGFYECARTNAEVYKHHLQIRGLCRYFFILCQFIFKIISKMNTSNK